MSEDSKEIVKGEPSLTGSQEGIVTPLEDTDAILLLKCPKCQKVHFRHAGYMHPLSNLSYKNADRTQSSQLNTDQTPVQICVSCKTAIIVFNGKIHDVTEHVDLKAWERTEVEAHKATGPGGQC